MNGYLPLFNKLRGIRRRIMDLLVPSRLQQPEFAQEEALSTRLHNVEQKVRFLVCENIRLNQVLRELIYVNDLSRTYTGSQTKDSFDYQWRNVGEGHWMPSNPEFLKRTPDMILERTQLPAEWFPDKRVLDAGCGSGRWTYGLLQLGAHVTCADQSKGALEEVRALVKGMGTVEFLNTDLLKLDLPSHSFDLVWCFGVAHHTENLIKAIKNLISVTAPGGYLFMMLYGYPESIEAFSEQASYEEWRRRLLPLPFAEKVETLKKHYPPELVHGYFDAVSPQINDLVTWEWIQTFLQNEGLDSIRRTIDHPNHHFVARKRPRSGS
jgi:SAM-dependent methyltransferase